MRQVVAFVVASLVVLGVGVVGAQQTTPAPSTQAPAAGAEKQVEGKIKAIDKAGNKVTLEDGTQVMIPAAMKAQFDTFKEGDSVKVSYSERAGQKVATKVEKGS